MPSVMTVKSRPWITYRANAAAQREAAEKTKLPNRREMHERSALTWETMTISAEATVGRALVN